MSNFVRNDKFFNQGKFKVYDDLSRNYVMDLSCDAVDKPFYRRYSFFNNCFNCDYFSSLTADCDYCKLTGISCRFNDLPCKYFKPIKISWFYRDYSIDDVHFLKYKRKKE